MRKLFHGFYEPSEKEFEKIWSDGLLVPDTNVLLHLFRFMPERRAEILAAFKSFGDRLWLPYQVASEFHAGWRSADSGNRAAYAKLKEELAKKRSEVDAAIAALSRFDPWPKGSSMESIGKFFEGLAQEVDAASEKLPAARSVFEAVTSIFEGKVGDPPVDLDARLKEAERRYQNKIPPGYKDEGRAGDYLIWAEMKEKAKAVAKPVLFLTDDKKEDWWAEHMGKKIGPRPELRQEFAAATDQMFYAYQPARFLALVAARTKNVVSQETVQEMERVQEERVRVRIPEKVRLRQELRNKVLVVAESLGLEPIAVLNLARNVSQSDTRIRRRLNFTPLTDGPSEARDIRTRIGDALGSSLAPHYVPDADWEGFASLVNHLAKEEVAAEADRLESYFRKRQEMVERINYP
ncbi:PIN-like domain-containing protein [Mesorhizobium sp. M0808]|uniref:PIN-like domain-containing protein n=1 Tax=Mesorhizobium sp. M0808 TaxID=2957002 RepID=UPI00333513B9